ncbi:uncharacterized protein LOC112526067 [Cynara cardunculus var. scolymus]|uniref:Transmembrane protein n=1 Tax=Cynara cardunculus var. scolymus TaxID=59895 RepID=A0A103Y7Z5_CYNCS|nr:uncharacterized protein LOC112526067 [Cynara cardunculus var. scolymus]KVI04193.1 hypothetical protein Ccrd_017491 [Cynara cardunculus var. scolymus]
MGTIKSLFFCFLFAGILFFRPTTARFLHFSLSDVKSYVSDPPLSAAVDLSALPPAPSPREEENDESGGVQKVHTENHRHSSDKSVAGGGVIIGGLATAVLATLYCYIRVTRRKDGGNH